ncbi:hypothetical protein OS190_09365 [Sulfitobacter sp. F26204]|uniref:hypothetical protein n=1 Tax=Sulfitobacter sp. F26204 TaxID=2996014 RepID=UPI00225DCE6A|nr:hypothetical protein [Sulfitobacter sp. F26204]MCX7559775.1 hypothetical protein [Sulfitobacter sp. F26204]
MDDSRTIPGWSPQVPEQDHRPGLDGKTASDLVARQVVKDNNLNVTTLDIEMSGMNRLGFLEKLIHLDKNGNPVKRMLWHHTLNTTRQ